MILLHVMRSSHFFEVSRLPGLSRHCSELVTWHSVDQPRGSDAIATSDSPVIAAAREEGIAVHPLPSAAGRIP